MIRNDTNLAKPAARLSIGRAEIHRCVVFDDHCLLRSGCCALIGRSRPQAPSKKRLCKQSIRRSENKTKPPSHSPPATGIIHVIQDEPTRQSIAEGATTYSAI